MASTAPLRAGGATAPGAPVGAPRRHPAGPSGIPLVPPPLAGRRAALPARAAAVGAAAPPPRRAGVARASLAAPGAPAPRQHARMRAPARRAVALGALGASATSAPSGAGAAGAPAAPGGRASGWFAGASVAAPWLLASARSRPLEPGSVRVAVAARALPVAAWFGRRPAGSGLAGARASASAAVSAEGSWPSAGRFGAYGTLDSREEYDVEDGARRSWVEAPFEAVEEGRPQGAEEEGSVAEWSAASSSSSASSSASSSPPALAEDPSVMWASVVEEALGGSDVYLVGMMGSGKSTIGRVLARALGYSFVDLDAEIESRAGSSIPELFAREGEEAFRGRETEALRAVPSSGRFVVATGGGAVLRDDNWLVMNRGLVVWIDVPVPELARRVVAQGVASRPLVAQGGHERDQEQQGRDEAASEVAEAIADGVVETPAGREGEERRASAENRSAAPPQGSTEVGKAKNDGKQGSTEDGKAKNDGKQGSTEVGKAKNDGKQGSTEVGKAKNDGKQGSTEVGKAQSENRAGDTAAAPPSSTSPALPALLSAAEARLSSILEARRSRYERAHVVADGSGGTPEEVVGALLEAVAAEVSGLSSRDGASASGSWGGDLWAPLGDDDDRAWTENAAQMAQEE